MTDEVPFLNERHISFEPSTLETVDFSVFDWLNEKMNLHVNTNEGFKKIPIKWVTSERAYHSKNDFDERDLNKTLVYPIFSIGRLSYSKNAESRGKYFGQIPNVNDEKGGSIIIGRRINQDKTANFANADSLKGAGPDGDVGITQLNFPTGRKNKKIVYETLTIPKPEYIQVDYDIKFVCEYQQQYNEVLQAFITQSGYKNQIILERDGHKYEAWIQEDFADESNVKEMGDDARKFDLTINLKVYAYLVGSGDNQEKPFIVERQNAVEFKFPRERIMMGEETPSSSRVAKTFPAYPMRYDGLLLWLRTNDLSSMYNEFASSTTVVDADNDPVGRIIDPANGWVIAATGNATRPTLQSSSDSYSYLSFPYNASYLVNGNLIPGYVVSGTSVDAGFKSITQNRVGTIVGRVYLGSSGDIGDYRVILSTNEYTTNNGFTVGITPDYKLDFYGPFEGALALTSTAAFPQDEWSTFAIVMDGTNIRLSVNGVSNSVAMNNYTSNANHDTDLYIGNVFSYWYFNDYIQQIMIYSSSLGNSIAEALAAYNPERL